MSERPCPVCDSTARSVLYMHTLTNGEEQTVYSCLECGMVYASLGKPVDYAAESIYAFKNASGSGGTQDDKIKQESLAWMIHDFGVLKDDTILDIGCAQGGLLQALRNRGFLELSGMDPSEECTEAVRNCGIHAYTGMLDDPELNTYELVIMSHVLEHVADLHMAVNGVKRRLESGGRVYVEVPDATRYARYNIPFLDFNAEHINHFGPASLARVFSSFYIERFGRRELRLPNGAMYSAIWILANHAKDAVSSEIRGYIAQSVAQLKAINAKFEKELEGETEVCFWGANSYFANLANLPVFKRVKIVQIVDRNPKLWSKTIGGLKVMQSLSVRGDIPIVIGSCVAIESIKADILAMRLPNKVVSV